MQEVRDNIARVRPGFPKEAKEPFIIRAEGDNSQPIVELTLMSDTRSLRELSTLTEQVITKRLQGVAGVGQVRVNGKTNRQILVSLKPEQLQSQNIGVDEVLRAIQSHQCQPAGR